jgi:hypothetical protein
MLDVDNVVPFLLERGLIEVAWIIDATLTIRSVSRRNRNLRIDGPEGRGFLIKQPDQPVHGRVASLRRESSFHRFCWEESAATAVTRFLPRLVHDRVEDAILVFELISDATALQIKSTGQGGRCHDLQAARALGQAMGTLHRDFRLIDPDRDPRLDWLPRALPPIFRSHQPGLEIRAGLRPSDLEILRILQTHGGFGEHLERLERSWRPETVIHGDIRFDNVLVRSTRGDDEVDAVELWIVDWEMVRVGDPAWDLAGALQDFLVLWVSSMPLSDDLAIEEMTAQARVPLGQFRAASRALWAGYRGAAALEVAEVGGFLRRAMEYVTVRLIQSAFELAVRSDRLAGQSVLLLQLSANLMADSELGQVQLFGIPPGSLAS